MHRSNIFLYFFCMTMISAGLFGAMPCTAGEARGGQSSATLESPGDLTEYGIFYNRYEPSFYTGFAPRSRDPRRLHLHVGRGNQLRVTLVLADSVLEDYAQDLLTRYQTYQWLIDEGQVKLTQNAGFEAFEKAITDFDLEHLVAEEEPLSAAERRARNLQLMEQLNPGRVFRIKMPVGELVQHWVAQVRPKDRKSMCKKRQLELLNLMLPTRLWLAELDPAVSKALKELVRRAPGGGGSQKSSTVALAALQAPFLQLLERVSHGMYPQVGDNLQFVEFTAIYPVGTLNQYTQYKGHQIPLYPTPGRRALTYHQRTKTVDHIPEVVIYSYLPWIPYMHVGKRLHNSFHTLWWRMNPKKTVFLPEEIINGHGRKSREGKPYHYLWLLSRGPMSHGCTHINAGHISELRQLLPSETDSLYQVDTFINKSYLYDVFDIDGDFEPEVMGVRYFVAYSLRNKKPYRLRAPIEREGFYDWLYGGELKYDTQGRGFFRDIKDGHFIGRKAFNGREYSKVSLYEAEYEPEKLQFYQLVDIPFARELRKVSVEYPYPQETWHVAQAGHPPAQ